MNEVLKQLIELTEVDRAIAQLREQLGRYPAMLGRMDESEARQQKTIEEADLVIDASKQERRKAEKEMQILQEQIRKYTVQQAAVKTNKEYQAITHEVEQIRAKIDVWETAGLEQLELEGAGQAKKKSATQQLKKLKDEHEAERRRIEEQVREKQEKLARLTSERERRFAEIPEELQDSYQLLNERAPGTVCASLEGENCGGCHWTLVPHTRQRVQRGDAIVRCEHCRRILYAPESGR